MSGKTISWDELSRHNNSSDCWVAIHGKVYDVTGFLSEHPGGEGVILNFAGKDATPGFEPIHNPDVLNLLPATAYVGDIDTKAAKPSAAPPKEAKAYASPAPAAVAQPISQAPPPKAWAKPPLEHLLNLFDFESVAQAVMKKEGWDYYSSGADDEITLRENHAAFQRIWLRPRVLINVAKVDTSCKMLGTPCSMPVYITATALGKLAHPEGEVVLTRAAATQGIVQMCPTLASCSLEEMMGARVAGQVQWFQLYVNRDRKITADIIKRAEKGGIKALFITVDAPQLGRREKDMRNKFSAAPPDVQKKDGVKRDQGTARAISTFIDPSLAWEDLKWFRSTTNLPIVLKGIQCGEDAVLAVKHGVQGIVVSNHGGRQLDYARSGIEILPEVMSALRSINAEKKIEVYVDGGVRRGTDIFKALALGAKAVGIGRPVLYGMAAYGQEGVERVLQILKEELDVCMRLMGTPTVKDIKQDMIITHNLSDHFAAQPKDYLATKTYLPLPKL